MTWNGSGIYALPGAYFPEVAGNLVDATRYNGVLNDLSTGLNNALAKDGQNAATGNLPMAGFRLTGLGDANVAGQALVFAQATNGYVSGNFGVGGIPTVKLDVIGTAAALVTSRSYNALSTSGAGAGFAAQADTSTAVLASFSSLTPTTGGTSWLYTNTNTPLILGTNTVERARLDTIGNFGIGGAPTVKLDVLSSAATILKARVYNSASASGAGAYFVAQSDTSTLVAASFSSLTPTTGGTSWIATTTATPLILGTSGNEQVRITSTGAVGIGGTPAYKLDVQDSAAGYIRARTTSSGNASLIASTAGGGVAILELTNGAGAHYIYGGAGGTQNLSFNVAGTEQMRIDLNGNLGIGCTPTVKLDIFASLASIITSRIYNSSAAAGAGAYVTAQSDTSTAVLGSFSSGFAGAPSTSWLYTNTNTPLVFGIGGTERARLDTNGNLGIGTTANASAMLDVQSTTKGFRLPNMTTAQKNAIVSPASGLMVFDITLAKACLFNGSAWQTITSV